jgi:hypothetical protein
MFTSEDFKGNDRGCDGDVCGNTKKKYRVWEFKINNREMIYSIIVVMMMMMILYYNTSITTTSFMM